MKNNAKTSKSTDFRFSKNDIDVLKKDWKAYAKKIPAYLKQHKKFAEKGIVYTAGGARYTTCAWISIRNLRDLGCTLPIELWHLGNELSDALIAKFKTLNVECRDFYELGHVTLEGYPLKPLAIINSRFKEVLFLDADNNCVSNPEDLFNLEAYQQHGAVFWPDYWQTSKRNQIWQITEADKQYIQEQESGQILINKEKCWKELQLCLYFNKLSIYYYKILYGDKDTFRFAWLALKSTYHMIEHPVVAIGYKQNDMFYGTTMAQHDPSGNIRFLHRNLLKWDVTHPNELSWIYLKKFKPNDEQKRIQMRRPPDGSISVDLMGEVEETDVSGVFEVLERKCLGYLQEWKNTPEFQDFLTHSHFSQYRYAKNVSFSI